MNRLVMHNNGCKYSFARYIPYDVDETVIIHLVEYLATANFLTTMAIRPCKAQFLYNFMRKWADIAVKLGC